MESVNKIKFKDLSFLLQISIMGGWTAFLLMLLVLVDKFV
jgi:hypothetical protein